MNNNLAKGTSIDRFERKWVIGNNVDTNAFLIAISRSNFMFTESYSARNINTIYFDDRHLFILSDGQNGGSVILDNLYYQENGIAEVATSEENIKISIPDASNFRWNTALSNLISASLDGEIIGGSTNTFNVTFTEKIMTINIDEGYVSPGSLIDIQGLELILDAALHSHQLR